MPERDLSPRKGPLQKREGDGRSWQRLREEGMRQSGAHPGLLAIGLAGLALGALAWMYLGPDLKRYLKMKSM